MHDNGGMQWHAQVGAQEQFEHEQQVEKAMNKSIAAAFVKAKREFAPALKTHTNPAFRSKYADLSACLEAVNDALLNNGIAVYQETFEDSSGVTVETVFLHETGEILRAGRLHVPAAKSDPQGYGSALTYCRRYSLMAACGIAAEDDDGNAASNSGKQKQAKQPSTLTPATVADHIAAIDAAADADSLKTAYAKAYRAATAISDNAALTAFEQAKDKRKAALTAEPAAV